MLVQRRWQSSQNRGAETAEKKAVKRKKVVRKGQRTGAEEKEEHERRKTGKPENRKEER